MPPQREFVPLPQIAAGGLGDLLTARHSQRRFAGSVGLAQLGTMLWCGYGRTGPESRTVPSAHALYPLRVRVLAGAVASLPAGAYRYDPVQHAIYPAAAGDHRQTVAETSFADAAWLAHAAALLVITGDIAAATAHFADQPPRGRRGVRYVWLEAGHLSQNVYLAASELGLGAALVAGFDDQRLGALLDRLFAEETTTAGDAANCADGPVQPLAILAVGPSNGLRPAQTQPQV